MLSWDIGAGSRLLVADLSAGYGRISGSETGVWDWGLGIRVPIKAFINATNCYVLDLEEGEKTLLLYEGEGKLSRVRSKLIYRDFPRVRPCTGRDSTLARKRIGLVL